MGNLLSQCILLYSGKFITKSLPRPATEFKANEIEKA